MLCFWATLKASATVVSVLVWETAWGQLCHDTFLASGLQLVHSTQRPGATSRQLLITATPTTDSCSSCSVMSPKYFGSRQELQSESCEGLPSLYSSSPGSSWGSCPGCQGLMACDFKKYFLLDLFSIPSTTAVRED